MNMQSLLKQAKQMQKEIGKAEKELEEKVFTKQQGGGVIQVTMKGNYEIESIHIDNDLMKLESKEDLELLMVSTINELIKEITVEKDETMKGLTGGVSMPGLF